MAGDDGGGGGGGGSAWQRAAVAFKSLVAGTLSGMAGKLIEYPMDVVKVRLQTQALVSGGEGAIKFAGPLDCLVQTARREGVRGLYRGVGSPLVGAIGENCACFLLYDQAQVYFERTTGAFAMRHVAASGALAGLGTTLVLTPVELVKCRLQVQQSSGDAARYRGVVHCVTDVLRTDGVRGLFTGASGTLLREVPGNAIWFSTFEGVQRAQSASLGTPRNELGLLNTALAGGCAGALYWLIPFPTDTIKSYVQTGTRADGSTHSLRSAAADIYATGGVRAFYRGCGLTVARAFPSNAVIFCCYEYVSRWLGVQ
mmetsp:Transcript_48842/g.119608  ORF Transcript_48842/g.119608 Transcript_48842/m.119608 type:complete len:313 (+) Transcript_48842:42-980(+)